MKTVTKREASDIDLKEKPNSTIAATLAVAMLLLSTPRQPGATQEEFTADTERRMRSIIAIFLDSLDEAGFSIVKNEIPSVFQN